MKPRTYFSLQTRHAVLLVGIALYLVTASVNLEVPLYHTYAQEAGYTTGLTAVVFATYVAGLLPVLIFLGGISDRMGRKPVLIIGLLSALLATLAMIVSPTIYTLFLTRFLQGIAVGLSVGTGTAYLAELCNGDAEKAANTVAITTSLGFGSGALFTSSTLLFQNTTIPLSYAIILALVCLCLVLAFSLPRTQITPTEMIRLPYFPAGSLAIGVAIALAWAVTGLVITVIPVQLTHSHLALWSGPALFMVNGTGALFQPLARRFSARTSLLTGFILLPLGYTILLAGAWTGLLMLVLLGAAIAGSACYGFTYLGGLAEVAILGGKQRARAVSGYFLCAYLGFGLPSILTGFIADSIGTMNALLVFGVLTIIISSVLFIVFGRSHSRQIAEPAA